MSVISAHREPDGLALYADKDKAIKQNFSNDDDDEGEEILQGEMQESYEETMFTENVDTKATQENNFFN